MNTQLNEYGNTEEETRARGKRVKEAKRREEERREERGEGKGGWRRKGKPHEPPNQMYLTSVPLHSQAITTTTSDQ